MGGETLTVHEIADQRAAGHRGRDGEDGRGENRLRERNRPGHDVWGMRRSEEWENGGTVGIAGLKCSSRSGSCPIGRLRHCQGNVNRVEGRRC